MVQFLSGNVLLKPAQKRRVLAHLKRCTKLGERIGDFKLFVQLQRTGRAVQARARLRDKAGAFEVVTRDNHWENAIDSMIRQLNTGVHAHRLAAA